MVAEIRPQPASEAGKTNVSSVSITNNVPAQPESNSLKLRNRAKRIACVECRQQKSKCNAQENAPNPCTRCATRGLVCTLKPDYKRTYKRARNAQLEHAYNDLRQTLNGLLKPLKAGENGEEDTAALFNTDLLQKLSNIVNTANALNSENAKADEELRGPGYRNDLNSNTVGNLGVHKNIITNLAYDPSAMVGKASGIKLLPSKIHPFAMEPQELLQRTSLNNTHSRQPVHLEQAAVQCESKTVRDITLSSDKIRELYVEFAKNYHPIFPVIDIHKGPEKLYRLCPALFWVIMLTALRRSSDSYGRSLLVQLSPIVKNVLEDLTIRPITRYSPSEFDEPVYNASSVYSVQAFLITTMWPPLASSLSADSSWNTIGIALFQAVRIGLHSPGHATDFSNAAKTDLRQLMLLTEQIRTWIACNIVSQTISTTFGYPAFTSFDGKLMRFLEMNNELDISLQMKQLMEVTDYESQIVNTLSTVTEHLERKPLIDLLAQKLDKMEVRFNYKDMDAIRQFAFLMARVHLYTYYFFDLKEDEEYDSDDGKLNDRLSLATKHGLIKLFNAAVALISHCQTAQTADRKFMKYLPGVYVISIWQAAFLITKISFSPLKDVIDFQKGKNMFQVAIYLTLRNSVIKFDMAYRFASIMQSLWQLFDTLYAKQSLRFEINITSRMAASIFFDCLLTLREKSGMMKYMISKDDDANSDVEGVDDIQNNDSNLESCTDIKSRNHYDESDYPDSDNSSSLDEKIKDIGCTPSDAVSNNTNNDSQSNGSHPSRRSHTLEDNTFNPENNARKIIKTIPLDPVPIHHNGKKGIGAMGSSTGSSAQSSPIERRLPRTNKRPDSKKVKKPRLASPRMEFSEKSQENSRISMTSIPVNAPSNIQNMSENPDMYKANINPIANQVNYLPNYPNTNFGTPASNGLLDMSVSPMQHPAAVAGSQWDDNMELWGTDLNVLLKDVSSVMNDFGFHDVYNEANETQQPAMSLFQQQQFAPNQNIQGHKPNNK